METKMKKLKKWSEIYPQGTKEGDDEQKLFIALVRDAKFSYKSTAMLVKETKLSTQRVEEILDKYVKLGLIFVHEANDKYWGYWERNPERVKKSSTLVKKDQDSRMKKYINQSSNQDSDESEE